MLKSFLSRLIANTFHVSPRRSRSRRSSPATQGALHTETLETRQLLTAGDLDLSFGGGDGMVTTAISSGADRAQSVAVQLDGKILVAGFGGDSGTEDVFLTRYLADGGLDASFGAGDGIVTTAFAWQDVAFSLAVQPDGKIVVTGWNSSGENSSLIVYRYLSDGALDLSFGSGLGFVAVDLGLSLDGGNSIAIQADGKLLVAGYAFLNGNNQAILMRFLPSGFNDLSFGGGDGLITEDFGIGSDSAVGVEIQSDGRIVLAAQATIDGNSSFPVARYLTDGSRDPAFGGGDGIASTAIVGATGFARDVAIQSDGKIIVAGHIVSGGYQDQAMVRYSANGELDQGFGNVGIVVTPVGLGHDSASSVAIQEDGKIVVGGYASLIAGNGRNSFSIARYLNSGGLDLTFGGGDGFATTSVGSSTSRIEDLAIQKDGKIVVAGFAIVNGSEDFALARYLGDTGPTNISLTFSWLLENQPVGTSIGVLTTTDEDIDDEYVYTLVPGEGDTDNASFLIDYNELKSSAGPLTSKRKSVTPCEFVRRIRRGFGLKRRFTISVLNVNEAPTGIALPNNTVAENQRSVTTVGQFTTLTRIRETRLPMLSLMARAARIIPASRSPGIRSAQPSVLTTKKSRVIRFACEPLIKEGCRSSGK